ncbi:MAG: hypothetical protein A3H96_11330 [Acidobacteria bacterium RIFCSPLOWO2_02_FULL_67_36]|nr:MAG: hypothetical protein A3H96_11330 [Acidobacteria bacterium RIFCSPLOWO2_02_FULL_67_36]
MADAVEIIVRARALTQEATAQAAADLKKVGAAASEVSGHVHGVGEALSKADEFVKIFSGDATKGMHGLGAGVKEQAAAMAEAVERMGGASKLVQSDQLKVNKTLTEAIAHYRLMGEQAPAAMVALADATRPVNAALSKADEFVKIFTGDATKGMHGLGAGVKETAAAMTEAVTRMGGASKLTATDQAVVNKTLTDAIAHYRLMGEQAPPAMAKLVDATRRAHPPTSDLFGALSKVNGLLGAFGIALSIGSIVAFGRSVLDVADAIVKMSDQTDFSITEVQRLQYIAGQSSSSVESLVHASQNLTLALGDENSGAAGAMRRLHINTDTFNRLGSYDKMVLLAEGIREMKDPTDQAEVAAALFGRTWKEILPAIKSGMKEVGDQAPIMATEAVRALDQIGDVWSRAGQKTKAAAGNLYLELVDQLSRLMNTGGLTNTQIAELTGATGGLKEALANIPKPAIAVGGALKGVTLSAAELSAAEADITKRGKELDATFLKNQASAEAFTTAQDVLFGRDLIARAKEYVRELGPLSNLSLVSAEKQKELNKAAEDAIGVYARLGKVAPQAIRDLYLATFSVANQIPLIKKTAQAWVDAAAAAQGFGEQLPLIHDKGRVVADAIRGIAVWSGKIPFELVGTETKALTVDFGALAQSLSQLSQISGGAFGGIAQQLSTVVGSINAAQQSVAAFKTGFAAAKSGETMAGIAGMATGIMGIATAAIQAGKAIYDMFFAAKGRAEVKDFASLMGGFDALHAQLNQLGAEGEKLWINLTQGVGRNNPAQAAAAIKLITDALAGSPAGMAAAAGYKTREELQSIAEKAKQVYDFMLGSGKYTATELAKAFQDYKSKSVAAMGEQEAAHQASIDAITAKYKEMMEKLDSEYASLQQSVAQEAEEAEMGDAETQQRARMEQIRLEKERLEAQKNDELAAAEDQYQTWVEAGKKTDDALAAIFAKGYRIPLHFDVDDVPGGGGSPSHAAAAFVAREPAGPAAFIQGAARGAMMGSGGGGGGGQWVAQVHMDSVRVGEVLLRRQGDILNRYRVNR